MLALSLPIGLATVHVYVPLSCVVIVSMEQSARNTALVLVWFTAVISVDSNTAGSLFFFQVNVSGGEPRDVQDNIKGELAGIVIVDDDGVSTTGAAVNVERWMIM